MCPRSSPPLRLRKLGMPVLKMPQTWWVRVSRALDRPSQAWFVCPCGKPFKRALGEFSHTVSPLKAGKLVGPCRKCPKLGGSVCPWPLITCAKFGSYAPVGSPLNGLWGHFPTAFPLQSLVTWFAPVENAPNWVGAWVPGPLSSVPSLVRMPL